MGPSRGLSGLQEWAAESQQHQHSCTQRSPQYCWTPLDATGHHWTSLDAAEYSWTLLNAMGHRWTPLDAAGLVWTQLDTAGHCLMPLNTADHRWTPLDATRHHWTLLDSAEHTKSKGHVQADPAQPLSSVSPAGPCPLRLAQSWLIHALGSEPASAKSLAAFKPLSPPSLSNT